MTLKLHIKSLILSALLITGLINISSTIAQEVNNADRLKAGLPAQEANGESGNGEANADEPGGGESVRGPEPDPYIDAVQDILRFVGVKDDSVRDIGTLLAAIVVLVGSFGTVFGFKTRTLNLELKKRLVDPFFKIANRSEIKVSNVLLVGDGGTGKTTLARAISGAKEINPYQSTPLPDGEQLFTYFISKEFHGKDTQYIHRVYLEDYRGQNLEHMKKATKFPQRCEELGSSVVIFVVDLFYPSPSGQTLTKPKSSWDQERIDELLKEYAPNNVMSGISDMCVNSSGINTCKMVCLFINKFDMLSNHSQNQMQKVIEEYRDLITTISNYFDGNEPKIIVGSLDKGWGVSGPYKEKIFTDSNSLYEYLLDYSVTIK